MSKAKINDLEFAERLQWILKEKFNGNNSEFARAVGIAITSLNRWLIGEADPSRSNLVKTAKAADVSLEWLATGEEPTTNNNFVRKAFETAQQIVADGISMVNSYPSINVSAGFGSFNEGVTQPEGQEPYSDALLAELGVKAEHCGVFWADGNSMEPTIANRDQMLVDFSKKEPKGNNIYVVQNGDNVWVKRIRMQWGLGLELISDNKDEYRPIIIPAEDAEHLQIIGQVMHIGHRLT